MKNKMMKSFIAIMCVGLCLSGSLLGCGENTSSTEKTGLSGVYEEEAKYSFENIKEQAEDATYEFGVELLKHTRTEKESTLVSPVSVYAALAMVANGADDSTLAQMNSVLGLSVPEMNVYMNEYRQYLTKDENCQVSMANGVWLNDGTKYHFKKETLKKIEDFYGAKAEYENFDNNTMMKINEWVDKNTNHMIPEVLKEMSPEAVMYLVNTLAFDAKWENQYEKYAVNDRKFTLEDGTQTKKSFMNSTENIYLSDEDTTGFVKYYKGNRFAFVGLLPNEDISLDDYVSKLSGKKLQNLLNNSQRTDVITYIPEFEKEYEQELSQILSDMGMEDAFDGEKADFSGFTEEENSICINRVIHKTYICVDPKGTKAAAVTAVEMKENCVMIEEEPAKVVILDRPFVYMLWDSELNVPLFLGTLEE